MMIWSKVASPKVSVPPSSIHAAAGLVAAMLILCSPLVVTLGLLAPTGGAQTAVTTAGASITADEVLDLVYALKRPWW